MKFQVIINNYNYSDYIEEAIVSVLNQTYKNYDLFIVDDGSTDNSREIIRKYHQLYPNNIYPVYKDNGGQGSAFNEAFQYSGGYDIITFLDADDYYFPNRLMEIVKYHREFDIVEHSLETSLNTCLYRDEKVDLSERLRRNRKFISFIPTTGVSYTKKILDGVFPIPEDITRMCADTYLNIFAIYNEAKVKTLRKCLGFYRIHDSNNWIHSGQKYKEIFNVFVDEINQKLTKRNLKMIPTFDQAFENQLNDFQFEDNQQVAVYGTGQFSESVSQILIKKGIDVYCYIETNLTNKTSFHEKPVISIQDFINFKQEKLLIIIANSYKIEVLMKMEKLKIKNPIITFDI